MSNIKELEKKYRELGEEIKRLREGKNWYHAFLEYYEDAAGYTQITISYEFYASAECLKVTRCNDNQLLKPLTEYVLSFDRGGIWVSDHPKTLGTYFCTSGYARDEKATYFDASSFLELWEEGRKCH